MKYLKELLMNEENVKVFPEILKKSESNILEN
jgi:hypothetical protein